MCTFAYDAFLPEYDVMILATVQTYFLLFRGGEYDVMICGHVCVFLRMMPFCLCKIKVAWF